MEYIDYHILCIKPDYFKDILIQLEENNYVRRRLPKPDMLSNRDFMIVDSGEQFSKKKKLVLAKLDFELDFIASLIKPCRKTQAKKYQGRKP